MGHHFYEVDSGLVELWNVNMENDIGNQHFYSQSNDIQFFLSGFYNSTQLENSFSPVLQSKLVKVNIW